MRTKKGHPLRHNFTFYEAVRRNVQVFPDRLAFVDGLPKTEGGEIDRSEVKGKYGGMRITRQPRI